MRRYRVTVAGRTYDVEIEDPRAKPITARVLDEVFIVEVDTASHVAAAALRAAEPDPLAPSTGVPPPPAAAGRSDQQVLTAPIPGTITAMSASVGQAVQRGDGLLTIEAMKMFNVIRSPWAGTIVAVHVTIGAHVAQGQLLISLSQS